NNTNGKIDSSKQYWSYSESYDLMNFIYHENGELKQTSTKCFGCIKSLTVIQEFDIYGNLILHKLIDHNGIINEWSHKFIYNKQGNWIAKLSSYQSQNKGGLIR